MLRTRGEWLQGVSVGENEKNPTALGVAVAKQQSQTIALTQNSNLETKHNKHKLLASLLWNTINLNVGYLGAASLCSSNWINPIQSASMKYPAQQAALLQFWS